MATLGNPSHAYAYSATRDDRSMPYKEATGYHHYRSHDGIVALVRCNSWRRSGDIPVSAEELAMHKQWISFDDLFYGEIREMS